MLDHYRVNIPFRKGADPHTIIVVYDRERNFRVEVSQSPTGRSTQVYVNNDKVYP